MQESCFTWDSGYETSQHAQIGTLFSGPLSSFWWRYGKGLNQICILWIQHPWKRKHAFVRSKRRLRLNRTESMAANIYFCCAEYKNLGQNIRLFKRTYARLSSRRSIIILSISRVSYVYPLYFYGNHTTFCNKEPLFLAYFRKNISTISSPAKISTIMDEQKIVVPWCKIKPNGPAFVPIAILVNATRGFLYIFSASLIINSS